MIKLAFFHSDLMIGGQQKGLVDLLSALDSSKFSITLFIFVDGPLREQIPAHIKVELIKAPKLFHFFPFGLAKRLLKLKPVVNSGQFDIAIDFSSFFVECAVGVSQCDAKAKIVWIHTDVEMMLKYSARYRISWLLTSSKFQQYHYSISVSRGAVDAFQKMTGFPKNRSFVIPNIVDYQDIAKKAKVEVSSILDESKVNFVFLGRLAEPKRVDSIIEHFANATKARNNIHLFIIGDGPLRHRLEKQVDSAGQTANITFLGSLVNPYPVLARMDCLIFLSDYEGQGIVVQEAKSLGLSLIVGKNLEKYNEDVEGVENVYDAILATEKKSPMRSVVEMPDYTQILSNLLVTIAKGSKNHSNHTFQ